VNIYAAPFVGVNPANGNLLFEDIDGNITEDLGVNRPKSYNRIKCIP
jgi:hypothetical protein